MLNKLLVGKNAIFQSKNYLPKLNGKLCRIVAQYKEENFPLVLEFENKVRIIAKANEIKEIS